MMSKVYVVASLGDYGPIVRMVTMNKAKAEEEAEKMGYDWEVIETDLED